MFSILAEMSILSCCQVENFCLFLNTAEAMFLNRTGNQVDFCLRRNPKTPVLLLCRTVSLFLKMYLIQLKRLNLSMFWFSSRFLPLPGVILKLLFCSKYVPDTAEAAKFVPVLAFK